MGVWFCDSSWLRLYLGLCELQRHCCPPLSYQAAIDVFPGFVVPDGRRDCATDSVRRVVCPGGARDGSSLAGCFLWLGCRFSSGIANHCPGVEDQSRTMCPCASNRKDDGGGEQCFPAASGFEQRDVANRTVCSDARHIPNWVYLMDWSLSCESHRHYAGEGRDVCECQQRWFFCRPFVVGLVVRQGKDSGPCTFGIGFGPGIINDLPWPAGERLQVGVGALLAGRILCGRQLTRNERFCRESFRETGQCGVCHLHRSWTGRGGRLAVI